MPATERMRYYPAVGPAIPLSKAGCSRVTHPFAGDALLRPLDLHVLSTPPAFVLSQDQTLRKCLIARPASWPAHLVHQATGMGGRGASLKLTEQIITDLLCCLNVFQRNLLHLACDKQARHTRFLAFDIVHAVEFSRIGRTGGFGLSALLQGNCSNLPPEMLLSNNSALSRRAIQTALRRVFHLCCIPCSL